MFMSLSDDLFPQDSFIKVVHDPHCMDDYNFGRVYQSLLARTLVMHLYTTLQQEIGLKSDTVDGFGIFGTRVISVEFTLVRSFPDLKKDVMASTKSDFKICHACFKNSIVKPSGPGALSLPVEKKTFFFLLFFYLNVCDLSLHE